MKNFARKFLTKQLFTDEEQAVRYFLGELSENEQSAVEERFFADEDYSRFLDAAENDLIDDYVCDKLDFRQTQNFERKLLISERRREEVRLAQILQTETFVERAVLSIAPSVSLHQWFNNLFRVPNLAWTGGLATIAILILLGNFWFINSPEKNQIAQIKIKNLTPVAIENQMQIADLSESSLFGVLPVGSKTPSESNVIQKQSIVRQNLKFATKPILEKRQATPRVKPKPIPALTLLPPVQSAEKPLIVGARNTENIRLRVIHNNAKNFIKYCVEIHAKDGDLIWSREIAVNEKTLQKPLALDVRRGALIAGTYELTISGATDDGQLEEVNFYNFTVEKNNATHFSSFLPVKNERQR